MTDLVARQVDVPFLESFCAAFNRHDLHALMGFLTDDCVFLLSSGPNQEGTAYRGREEVRRGFSEVFATFPDAQWEEGRHLVCGDRGLSEWVFRGTRTDGTRVEVNGMDVFTFRDGKIAVKDSFRKQRSF